MGVRVIVGKEDGGEGPDAACLYDSTTGWAFGPLFVGIPGHPQLEEAKDEAEAFLVDISEAAGEYYRLWDSARLEDFYAKWLGHRRDEVTEAEDREARFDRATGEGRR